MLKKQKYAISSLMMNAPAAERVYRSARKNFPRTTNIGKQSDREEK